MAVAVGGATMTLMRLCGAAGMSLASILLLILGNASSGGILPAAYLRRAGAAPPASLLPVGVGVQGIQGLAYFHQDGLAPALGVPAASIASGVAAFYLGGRPHLRGEPVAADEEEVVCGARRPRAGAEGWPVPATVPGFVRGTRTVHNPRGTAMTQFTTRPALEQGC